jgi:tRNA dimethylallyltransferase
MNEGAHSKPVVLIAGPTASGKSAVAMELARAGGGVIINADALQVYRELRILTARPTVEEEREIPHRLYGTVPASEPYSVALWLDAAREAIEESWTRNQIPIVTGGTGLYFKALEEGIASLPAIPPPVRQRWRDKLRHEGAEVLHAELARLEQSEAERLKPSDGQRIVRALEVIEATGKPLSAWQTEAGSEGALARSPVLRLYLSPPREELYARINQRFEHMIEAGGLREAEALLALQLSPSLPALKATGIPQLHRFLAGEIGFEESCRIAKRDTRHYAKRQLTWARRNMIAWKWLCEKLTESSLRHFVNFIRLND